MEITNDIAAKVLEVVDAGLVSGVGDPIPGKMCVEAAVCFALGLPHGDDPGCVSPALRRLKIYLNDSYWSSKDARAKGLRRLAVAQLGSKDVLDEKEFVGRLVDHSIRVAVPLALRDVARSLPRHADALLAAATQCETEGDIWKAQVICRDIAPFTAAATAANYASFARDAYSALAGAPRHAADYDDYDEVGRFIATAGVAAGGAHLRVDGAVVTDASRASGLAWYAEEVVQILVSMNAPGCQWLYLTEEEAV